MLKMICPQCQGNGFVKKQVDAGRIIEQDCDYCDNQGEVEISENAIEELRKLTRVQ